MDRNAPLYEYYDAVIIGSGIGGLTCATYLARRGLRVIVCEKSKQAGGLMGGFRKKGFKFDLALPSIGSAGLVFHVLDDLGIRSELEFHETPYRLVAPHFDFMPRSFDDVIRELSRAFPQEKTGIKAYFSLLQRISQEICDASTRDNPLLKEGKERLLSFLPFLFDSRGLFLDYFRHKNFLAERKIRNLIRNEDLRNFLISIGFSHHKNVLLDALIWNSLIEDSYYPSGGMGRIPEILLRNIRRYGGHVATGTEVKKILTRKGKASGVLLADGTKVESNFVVSNADYKKTFLSLLQEDAIPGRFRDRVREAQVCESFFTAFLGVGLPPEKLIPFRAPHTLHFPTYMYVDFDKAAKDPAYFQKAWQCISVPSLLDPDLAPKGKSVVAVRTWTTAHYQNGWEGGIWDGEQSSSYKKLVDRVGRDVIASAETVLPGLESHIEFCEFATPVTIERLTGNTEGAIAGWSIDPQATFYRDIFRQVQGFFSPVPHLLLAGHWTAPPGGLPVALASGRWVADQVSSFQEGVPLLDNVPSFLRSSTERIMEKTLSFISSWR